MTDEGIVEKIVTSEIDLEAAREASVGTVTSTQMDVARGEETEIVEAEQIVTYNVEEETKTVVKSMYQWRIYIGLRGTRAPPLGPKISLFSCSFREKLAK